MTRWRGWGGLGLSVLSTGAMIACVSSPEVPAAGSGGNSPGAEVSAAGGKQGSVAPNGGALTQESVGGGPSGGSADGGDWGGAPGDGGSGTGSSVSASGGANTAQREVCRSGRDPVTFTSVEVCVPEMNCPVGETPGLVFADEPEIQCLPCGDGYFKDTVGSSQCLVCRTCGSLSLLQECRADHDTECEHWGQIFRFGTKDIDGVTDAVMDPAGDVRVTGNIWDVDSGVTRASYVANVPLDGAEPEVDEFISAEAWARGIAVASDGAVWVAGFSDGDLPEPVQGMYDTFVRRDLGDGSAPTVFQLTSPGDEKAQAIAPALGGDVWIAGETNDSLFSSSLGSYDLFIQKYSPSGAVISKQFGGPGPDYIGGLATDSSGDAWIAASVDLVGIEEEGPGRFQSVIYRAPADGGDLETFSLDLVENSWIEDLVVDAEDGVWIVGQRPETPGGGYNIPTDAFVRKYLADGTLAFSDEFGSPGFDYATSLGFDDAGNLWVVGSSECSLADDKLDHPIDYVSSLNGTIDMVARCAPLEPGLGSGDIFARVYPAGGSAPRTFQVGSPDPDGPVRVLPAEGGGVWIVGSTGGLMGGFSKGSDDGIVFRMTL
jgi:hypothetical protein